MMFFKKFSLEDWSIIFIALAVGTLMVGPSFYFHYFDPTYKGIEFFASDAEMDYLAQIQEVYDGYWSSGNIYLADEKNSPYLNQNLAPIIVALIGKTFGLSARDINMAAKFFLPALLTILVYAFFANIFGRKDLAILMAVFVMLAQATSTFLNPTAWFDILLKGQFPGTEPSFLSYARPINPQISSFFFFGYLLCLWKFLFSSVLDKLKKIWGLAGTIILGLSFYVYFFTFSFLFAFNGCLLIYFLFLKNWQSSKKIIYVSLGAFFIGLFYLINAFQISFSVLYDQAAKIAGVIDTHRFIFSRLWWGTAVIFLLLYRGSKQTKIFIWAFLAAAFLVTNQQLITGKTAPVPAHYHWYYIAPITGAILFYLLFVYLEKIINISKSKLLIAALTIIFLYSGFLFQKSCYVVRKDPFISYQRYADVVFWLERNISEESAILSNGILSFLIVDYTHHDVYDNPNITNFLISSDRLKHLYYTGLFLNGITKDSAKDFFYENRHAIGNRFFGQYYRQKNGCYGCFDDKILDSMILEYQNFLEKDFISQLKKNQLDYVVWDKEKNPSWDINHFFNKKIYEKNNIIIYKV